MEKVDFEKLLAQLDQVRSQNETEFSQLVETIKGKGTINGKDFEHLLKRVTSEENSEVKVQMLELIEKNIDSLSENGH